MASTLVVMVALAGPATALDAQTETASWPPAFSLSLRGESALPVGELADFVGRDTGLGLGLALRARVYRGVSIYAGWDQFRFDGRIADFDFRLRDSGFRGGAQLTSPPLDGGWATPFVAAGAALTRMRIDHENGSGNLPYRSPLGVSLEVGGGVAARLNSRLWLVPEIRLRRRLSQIETAPVEGATLEPAYLGLNLGLLVRVP